MSTVRITPNGDGWSSVSFRYDPEVIDLIKTFPSSARRWNPATKVWAVEGFAVRELAALLTQYGHRVIEPSRTTPPPRSAPHDSWADALMDAVGRQRIEPVHRALTRVLHPDVGGDTELMQALNAARDRQAVRRGAA